MSALLEIVKSLIFIVFNYEILNSYNKTQEAPVISKAAFLIETAYFVNRCNRKDWPDWIKMNVGTLNRQFGSQGSPRQSISNPNKRCKVYQLAAANMFFSWGEVLAEKLEAILNKQNLQLDFRLMHLIQEVYHSLLSVQITSLTTSLKHPKYQIN